MTSELKPCPFCGRVPHRTDDESDIYYIGHDVDCYIVSVEDEVLHISFLNPLFLTVCSIRIVQWGEHGSGAMTSETRFTTLEKERWDDE